MDALMGGALMLLAAFGAACGVNMDPRPGGQAGKITSVASAPVTGKVVASTGETLDLSTVGDRPLVVIMAGEFCETCQHEVGEFKHAMGASGVPPGSVRFVTILVGADLETAAGWKDDWQVPWEVTYQDGDALFRARCPEALTPCVLVQLPGRGVVLRRAGQVPPSLIEEFTGPWE